MFKSRKIGKNNEILQKSYWTFVTIYTLFEIFIFCPKIKLWFPEKMVDFFEWKTRENVVVLDFLAVNNVDFTRKIDKKMLGQKLVKMLEVCKNWIFGQKFPKI